MKNFVLVNAIIVTVFVGLSLLDALQYMSWESQDTFVGFLMLTYIGTVLWLVYNKATWKK